MNKKTLCLTITLLASVMMLSTPLVSACRHGGKPNKWTNFSAFMVSGPPAGAPVVTFYPEPPAEPVIKTVVLQETMVVCQLTFGDKTYSLGTDFTYESELTLTLYLNTDPVVGTLRARKTITFDSASPNHDLDGTLEFFVSGLVWPEPNPDPDDAMDSWGRVRVYGTGDLEGVSVRGVGWQDDEENIIYQGLVKGWPE
jgi:hypothetical protein